MNTRYLRGTLVGAALVIAVGWVVSSASVSREDRLVDVASRGQDASRAELPERNDELDTPGDVPALAEAAASMDDAGRRVVTVTGCRRFCI